MGSNHSAFYGWQSIVEILKKKKRKHNKGSQGDIAQTELR